MKRITRCLIVMCIALPILLGIGFIPVFADDKPFIALSQNTTHFPWSVTLNNDMKYWAKKTGVEFIWTDGDNDGANQLADCEDLIAKKPDVLLMNAIQAEALTPVYEMCNKAGVPLIVFDRAINAEPGTGMYLTFIGEDQVEEGRVAGRMVVEAIKEKNGSYRGNVLELQGTIGASVTVDRHEGFVEILNKYPNIKIAASQSGNFGREPALKIMQDWLQAYPKGRVDAVYAHNDEMGLGALAAIKSARRTELLGYIASIDGQIQALEAVLKGEFLVSVQNPPYFGEPAFTSALKYLEGYHLPAVQWVPFKIFHAQDPKTRAMTQQYYNYLKANDLYF
jgi:ABC-type sugar transport system substrate-binding protein